MTLTGDDSDKTNKRVKKLTFGEIEVYDPKMLHDLKLSELNSIFENEFPQSSYSAITVEDIDRYKSDISPKDMT